MAGVHDQAVLLTSRRRQRLEHRVEAPGEPADLCATRSVDRLLEVARRGDTFGGIGQSADRGDRAARDEPPGYRSHHDGDDRDEHDAIGEIIERLIDLAQRAGDLHEDVIRCDRGDPGPAAVDRSIGEHRCVSAPGVVDRCEIRRERGADVEDHLTIRRHHPKEVVPGRLVEERLRTLTLDEPFGGKVLQRTPSEGFSKLRAADERPEPGCSAPHLGVDFLDEFAFGGCVDALSYHGDCGGDDEHHHECDAEPQAHGHLPPERAT